MPRAGSSSKNKSTANLGFGAGFDSVHFRLAPIVLANGPAAAGPSNQSGDYTERSAGSKMRATNSQSLGRQGDIRRVLIEANLVDSMVALPGPLFYSTQIPLCLGFLSKSKTGRAIESPDKATPGSFR